MTIEPASVAACSTLRLSSQKTLPCRQKAIWCSEIRRQTECHDQQSTAPISNDTRCRAGSEDRGGKLDQAHSVCRCSTQANVMNSLVFATHHLTGAGNPNLEVAHRLSVALRVAR
jgi:hypothetical protein